MTIIVNFFEDRMRKTFNEEEAENADDDEQVSLHIIMAVSVAMRVVVIMLIGGCMHVRLMRVTTMTMSVASTGIHMRQRVEEDITKKAADGDLKLSLREVVTFHKRGGAATGAMTFAKTTEASAPPLSDFCAPRRIASIAQPAMAKQMAKRWGRKGKAKPKSEVGPTAEVQPLVVEAAGTAAAATTTSSAADRTSTGGSATEAAAAAAAVAAVAAAAAAPVAASW